MQPMRARRGYAPRCVRGYAAGTLSEEPIANEDEVDEVEGMRSD
jgi:hypothetical protein